MSVDHGTDTIDCPGLVIWITPPQVHIHLQLLLRAKGVLIEKVGVPGIQGAGITGTQGAGVGTPAAATVAAITAGLIRELHIPKGGILAIGAKSIIVAAGFPSIMVGVPLGITIKELGVIPKEHFSIAPITTCLAIYRIH